MSAAIDETHYGVGQSKRGHQVQHLTLGTLQRATLVSKVGKYVGATVQQLVHAAIG